MSLRIPALVTGVALGSPLVAASAQGLVAPAAHGPDGFLANRGQAAEVVQFEARQGDLRLWATERALVLALPAATPELADVALYLRFPQAAAGLAGEHPLAATAHFFSAGADPVLGVPSYGEVLVRAVAPGVDLRLSQHGGQLKYDVEVAPFAGLDEFELRVDGADHLELLAPDELVLHTAAGPLTQSIPDAWEVAPDGSRRFLDARFALRPDGGIGFELPGRDPARPAVIDPVLGFAGYLGGSACDFVHAIAVDSLGNSYVAGISQSADFPTTAGVIDSGWLNDEAFLASYDSTGTTLRYSTFLGGSGDDRALAIDIDDLGTTVWLGGETESADFPTTSGTLNPTKGDFEDGFVARLSGAGTVLDWSGFLGGNNTDRIEAILVEPTGRVDVVGTTASTDFPVTAGVGQPTLAGGSDAFAAKIAASGASLLASTYFGGSADDFGTGVTAAVGGELIIAGTTRSDDLATSPGALQPNRAGGEDGFLARFNAAASALVYGTYLGGSGDDGIAALATWPAQTPYVVGRTESSDFPTSPGALFPGPLGLDDAFISVLTADATGFVHSTYLGGSGNDSADGLALDPVGTSFIVGTTDSTDLPVTPDAFQSTPGGNRDLFQATVKSDGTAIEFVTYYGGPADDDGHAIDHDDFTGAVCFGGHVLDGVPATAGVHDPTFNGGSGDGFLVCYTPLPCPTPAGAVNLGGPCDTAVLTVPPLVQGTFVTLTVDSAPPLVAGLLYTSPSGATPILWEGVCNIWVDIFAATAFLPILTDVNGDWSQAVGLPNDAPRCAQNVTFQAVLFDPVGGPATFGQLTNGVECTFGS